MLLSWMDGYDHKTKGSFEKDAIFNQLCSLCVSAIGD